MMAVYTFDFGNGGPVSCCVDIRADSEEQAVERMRAFAETVMADERWFQANPSGTGHYDDHEGSEGVVELRFYLDAMRPEKITTDTIGVSCDE